MVRKYYEIVCDKCGCAEHFLIGGANIEKQARSCGWIITAKKKHYDSEECFKGAHANKDETSNVIQQPL